MNEQINQSHKEREKKAMAMVRGLLINVIGNEVTEEAIEEGKYETIHGFLNDAFFDTFYFRIKGYNQKFIAFVDDCGLIKDLPISAIYEDGQIALVGNIFITCFTKDGDLTSLTTLDIAALKYSIKEAFNRVKDKMFVTPVLTNIEKRW